MFGADLASVDDPGQPDWQASKTQGLGFVFLRSNYGVYHDPFYVAQIAKLRAAGIPYGPYLFLRFPFKGASPDSPEDQAMEMIRTIGAPSGFDFPPVIDVEFPGKGISETGLTPAQAIAWVLRAWKVLRDKYSVAPIIYTSARVWHEDLKNPVVPEFTESPLWLAHYAMKAGLPAVLSPSVAAPEVPPMWGDSDNWWIHQYQGDSVKAPGFHTTTDLNRFNYMVVGAKGTRVKWVQKRLGVEQTGLFGAPTYAALKAFQAANGLTADAIIGPKTFAHLAWVKV